MASVCPSRMRISTHAPAGGATKSSAASAMSAIFLLTPLREGRPRDLWEFTGLREFLLTPLREGRHLRRKAPRQEPGISTHAPAGGATVAFAMARTVQSPFLLTPLREGRLYALEDREPAGAISTHAPAGGATGTAKV